MHWDAELLGYDCQRIAVNACQDAATKISHRLLISCLHLVAACHCLSFLSYPPQPGVCYLTCNLACTLPSSLVCLPASWILLFAKAMNATEEDRYISTSAHCASYGGKLRVRERQACYLAMLWSKDPCMELLLHRARCKFRCSAYLHLLSVHAPSCSRVAFNDEDIMTLPLQKLPSSQT